MSDVEKSALIAKLEALADEILKKESTDKDAKIVGCCWVNLSEGRTCFDGISGEGCKQMMDSGGYGGQFVPGGRCP